MAARTGILTLSMGLDLWDDTDDEDANAALQEIADAILRRLHNSGVPHVHADTIAIDHQEINVSAALDRSI